MNSAYTYLFIMHDGRHIVSDDYMDIRKMEKTKEVSEIITIHTTQSPSNSPLTFIDRSRV